jgi:hypothetical protein
VVQVVDAALQILLRVVGVEVHASPPRRRYFPLCSPMLDAVTLQAPELSVSVEHQAPASLRQVLEMDLTPQTLDRRATASQRAAVPDPHGNLVHGQVRILPGLLHREQAGKDSGVAFGGHAAVVVASDVAGHAVRQQSFSPVYRTHHLIILEYVDRASFRGQNISAYTNPMSGG